MFLHQSIKNALCYLEFYNCVSIQMQLRKKNFFATLWKNLTRIEWAGNWLFMERKWPEIFECVKFCFGYANILSKAFSISYFLSTTNINSKEKAFKVFFYMYFLRTFDLRKVFPDFFTLSKQQVWNRKPTRFFTFYTPVVDKILCMKKWWGGSMVIGFDSEKWSY